jgi:hypothetical protein
MLVQNRVKNHFARLQDYIIIYKNIMRATYYDMSLCKPLHACNVQDCTTKNAPIDFVKPDRTISC